MHAGPSRTRLVRAATPARSVTDSMRGLPSKESPTQTDWKAPDWSAISDIWSICSGVVTPNRTPRLGSVKPICMSDSCTLMKAARSTQGLVDALPGAAELAEWDTLTHALLAVAARLLARQ